MKIWLMCRIKLIATFEGQPLTNFQKRNLVITPKFGATPGGQIRRELIIGLISPYPLRRHFKSSGETQPGT
jgi:hypothetical protein